jgi:hypothetical protein
VVQGQLIARVGDARVEVGPGAYAALPRGVPHTIEVVGDQATLLVSFVPGGLERLAARPGRFRPDVPLGAGPRRAAFVTVRREEKENPRSHAAGLGRTVNALRPAAPRFTK